jgi:VWFA-related protein
MPAARVGRRFLPCGLGLVLLAAPAAAAQETDPAPVALPPRHATFLADVAWLATPVERQTFLALGRDYQRDAFIERFWRARDPFPETARNEFRERWEERLVLARERYREEEDERARALLLLGEPRSLRRPACRQLLNPVELWYYESAEWLRGEFFLVFFQPQGALGGRHRLWQAGEGLLPLFDFVVAAGRTPAELARQLVGECPSGDELLGALGASLHWDAVEKAMGRLLRPGDEWLRTFEARSTDVPAGAPELEADLAVRFPGRRQSRTIVEALVAVAGAGAGSAEPGPSGVRNLLVDGEVVLREELFESFRYRFDVPATSEDAALPLVLERYLRPGNYTLVLRVQDLNSDRVARVERQLEVPTVAAGPPPWAGAGVPDGQGLPLPPDAGPAAVAPALEALAEVDAARRRDEHGIKLFAPGEELKTGRLRVEAAVTGDGVARVAFALDGRPVLAKVRPPYSVELDLGRAPRLHRLRAAALDREGRELASDELLLNAGPHRFRVRLLQPQRGARYDRALRAEAEVEVPRGERLERLEFYLNDTRVATLYQPPFAQPLVLPAAGELTYVRAVAYLEGGNSSEDVVFVNAPDFVGEVRVDLVELYATVLDRQGQPVEGLERSDFTVLEDGQPQKLLRFERVRDLPIHAGILLDTSASMLEELEDAVRAGLRFFHEVMTPRDRAAVITFNERPALAVPFTSNSEVLAGGLAALTAEGETALYDSLIYALHYFSGIQGKRALILLSDGQDVASRYSYEEALEFARRTGVAVYAIGLDLPQREFDVRSKLVRLAAETGGHHFFVEGVRHLDRVYERVQSELRSQYLLAYQSPQQEDGERYREVEVKVGKPGLEAKTVRGYYP